MMIRVGLVAAVLLVAGVVEALPPYAIHPGGTDPVAHGQLVIESGTRGCFNVPLLSADPSNPTDGHVWFVHTLTRHQGCVRMGGVTRCWDAVLTP